MLPSGTTQLIINLREDETRVYSASGCQRLPGALVVGAHARPFVIGTAEQAAVMGVLPRARQPRRSPPRRLAGATSVSEPALQLYGDRSAGVRDPSGTTWWLATHVEDVSDAELERRMRAAGR